MSNLDIKLLAMLNELTEYAAQVRSDIIAGKACWVLRKEVIDEARAVIAKAEAAHAQP